MKKTFIASFILCFSGMFSDSLFAQEYKSYDLSKYYTPDIVRNQLDVSGSGSGSFNNTIYDYNNNNFSGSLNAVFTGIVNTRKMIRTISGGFDLATNNSKENYKTINSESEANTFANSDHIGVYYQLFNSKKQFLAVGGSLSSNYSSDLGNKTNSLNQSDNFINRDLEESFNPYIGIGLGRIEIVTEARQAVYLIDAFTKNKVLTRDLTEDEIFKLAQEMSRTKNKRFLDARLHLMDEVSHVDSFFVSNNLIVKQDARYFTNLYDIWLYGAAFERKSGYTIELRLNPDFYYASNYSKYNYSISNYSNSDILKQSLGLDNTLSLIYQLEKPVNQKWQHSVMTQVSGLLNLLNFTYTDKFTGVSDTSSSSEKYATLAANYKLGFYPNTRTNIYAQITEDFNSYFGYSSKANGVVYTHNYLAFNSTTGLNLGLYYYVSPQLRFSASGGVRKSYHSTDIFGVNTKKNSSDGQFLVGFNYSFF